MRTLTEDERVEQLICWLEDGTARQIRERAGWSRERCADRMGMAGPMSILRWELGKRLPSHRAALKYHRLLLDLRRLPAAGKRDGRFGNRGAQKAEPEADR